MSDEQSKLDELIEAIKTINEFKKMQDSYIAEIERQNEELREKLAAVEAELDDIKNDDPGNTDLAELYKKYFGDIGVHPTEWPKWPNEWPNEDRDKNTWYCQKNDTYITDSNTVSYSDFDAMYTQKIDKYVNKDKLDKYEK